MSYVSFDQSTYHVRKQVFKLFGGTFRIYDTMDNLVLFASMRAFRLREDIRLYTGEDKSTEVLTIKARQIIDWSAAYDVWDPVANQKIGALKRKGWKSMLRDEWVIMDSLDQDIGVIREDSTGLAVVRRVMSEVAMNLIPQSFHGEVRGAPAFVFRQRFFNPFVLRMDLDFSPDTAKLLDRRLGLAAAVLLCAIEGRQH